MIYQYELIIKLLYNNGDVNETVTSSGIIFEFKDNPKKCTFDDEIEITDKEGKTIKYQSKATIELSLDAENVNSNKVENSYISCEIQGVLARNEEEARIKTESLINKICKGLSLLFFRYNKNCYLYQPRIEANWLKAKLVPHDYRSYINSKKEKKVNATSDNTLVFCDMFDISTVGDRLNIQSIVQIPADKVCIDSWINQKNDMYSYLFDEFYSALGTEKSKSKFFHLFAMIEFCERQFEDYNESIKLFSAGECDILIKRLKEFIRNKENQDKITSRIKGDLVKITDIGRTQKLFNILHWMKIEKVCYPHREIDMDLLCGLINVRNRSFHGNNVNEQEYIEANEKLFYICDKILNYVEKNLL